MGLKQSIMGGSSKENKSISGGGAKDRPAEYPKPTQGFIKPPAKLSDLGGDMLSHICDGLDTQTLGAFANSNRLFRASAQQSLAQRMAQALLAHIVRGEQDEAEELLKNNPKLLLFKTGNIFDYSGRSIKGLSAWQAALCAGDAEMLAMMKPYFDSIRVTTKESNGDTAVISGEHIRLEQTHQVFPEGFEAHVAEQAVDRFNFDAVIAAINTASQADLESAIDLKGAVLPATHAPPEKTNDGTANELTKALNAFRQAFTTQSLQEKVFNPQHLLRALEKYNAQYGGWDGEKRQVFWSQVVGFTQRFMPACYAQAFAQGLYYLTKEPNPERLKRSLSFRFGRGEIFSDGGVFVDLGFKSAVRPCHGTAAAVVRILVLLGGSWLSAVVVSKNYVKQKQATLRTYARTRAADPVSTLVALSR